MTTIRHRYIDTAKNIPESCREAALAWAQAWGDWTSAGRSSAQLDNEEDHAHTNLSEALLSAGATRSRERDGYRSWTCADGTTGHVLLTCEEDRQAHPIPLQTLITTADEKAVWHATFGAAFALRANTYNPDDVARHHGSFGGITRTAQLIAQAAVLEYRRIA